MRRHEICLFVRSFLPSRRQIYAIIPRIQNSKNILKSAKTMILSACLLLLFVSMPIIAQQSGSDDIAALRGKLAQDEKQLADWPQLSRFGDANAKVIPPSAGERRIVFMGDSITDSWDDGGFGPFFP